MGSLSIAGTSYSDIVTLFSGITLGGCYLIEPIGNAPVESAPMYEEQHVVYPGVDGMGVRRYGFRGRIIIVEMGFLNLTKTLCETDKNTFHTSVSALASFSITLPGGTARSYCRLSNSQPIGWQQYGLTTMLLKHRYEFLQVREN
jgi:hypothetical protein